MYLKSEKLLSPGEKENSRPTGKILISITNDNFHEFCDALLIVIKLSKL
jgi:hypothetical protein